MKFHVLTLFPEMIEQGLTPSIIGRAVEKNLLSLNAVNIRDFSKEKHSKVDDYTYGGGAGMLLQAQPVFDAWKSVAGDRKVRTVYLTPQGTPFTQKLAAELAKEPELIFLCGHYEGIDERVLEEVVTDSVSIGDYVLTGGELPAMVMIDAIARLVPGVLGNDTSAEEESFFNDLLEYPQYSRPETWHEKKVPEVLLSGDHKKITKWRLERSIEKTKRVRPDLYAKYALKQEIIKKLSKAKRNHIHMIESLSRGLGEVLYYDNDALVIYDRGGETVMLHAGNDSVTEAMYHSIPKEAKLLLVTGAGMARQLEERGYVFICRCSQFLYTAKDPLPVKYKEIRPLTLQDLDYVEEHYDYEDRAYLTERLQAGMMYGAYHENRPVGFIGVHAEGSLGMLYVDPAYRRQGLAASLEAYLINRCIERGWTAYGHVINGNEESKRLQDKLGLYQASNDVYWLGTAEEA